MLFLVAAKKGWTPNPLFTTQGTRVGLKLQKCVVSRNDANRLVTILRSEMRGKDADVEKIMAFFTKGEFNIDLDQGK